ncbi:MAG: EamA family transporter [Candidatus Woesearchaeota archaeon]|nr:EamA family transporter [Candidatus Woesearchaeota archaeon]
MINPVAIAFLIPAIILGGFGSIYLKKGTKKLTFNIKKIKDNMTLAFGLFLFGSSMLFYMSALRFGELTTLYPLSSFTYIVVCILSARMLKEKISNIKWAGIALIIFGSFLVVM